MSTIPQIKNILYATDLEGSHTRPVFRLAVSLAKQYEARVTMLHVVEPIGTTGRAVIDAYLPHGSADKLEDEGLHKVLARMKERLKRFCDEEIGACDATHALVNELLVISGHPSEEIVRTADKEKSDLIVIGSCTHALFGRSVMGSTARQVSQHSHIPVLLVPNC